MFFLAIVAALFDKQINHKGMGQDIATATVEVKKAAEVEELFVYWMGTSQDSQSTTDMILEPFLYLDVVSSKKLQPKPNKSLFSLKDLFAFLPLFSIFCDINQDVLHKLRFCLIQLFQGRDVKI